MYLKNPDAWESYRDNNINYRDDYGISSPDYYPCIVIHDVVHTTYHSYSVYGFVYPYEFE